jgi:putative spermidine/putrescine transport system permease protein
VTRPSTIPLDDARTTSGSGLRPLFRRVPSHIGLLAPVLVFYATFLIGPYLALLVLSFYRFSSTSLYTGTLTLDNYLTVLVDKFYLSMLGGTILLGLGVTVVTLILGYPLALSIVRASPRVKAVLLIASLSPMLVNLVVRTYAWLVLLGDHGIVNSWLIAVGVTSSPLPINSNYFAVVVGLVHVTLPLMILSLVGIMERIDPSLLEAAESLGAGSFRILRRVHIHLSLPGIGTGSLLVFCSAISAFVTPRLLGGNRVSTISTVIYEKFTFSLNWPLGATLVFLLLAVNFAVILLHGRMFGER